MQLSPGRSSVYGVMLGRDTVAMQVHRIFGRLAISASRRGVMMSCQTLQTYVRRNCRPIFYILLTSQGQRFSTKHRSFNGSAALAGFRLFQMDTEIGKVATSDVRNANIKSDRSRADEHERASPKASLSQWLRATYLSSWTRPGA